MIPALPARKPATAGPRLSPRGLSRLVLVLLGAWLLATVGASAAQSVDRSVPDPAPQLDASAEVTFRALIARMVGGPATAGSLDEFFARGQIVGDGHVPIHGVWAYQTGGSAPDGCDIPASAAAGDTAYCAVGHTVSYDIDWLRWLYRQVGPAGPAIAVGHAWSSYVVNSRGGATSSAAELQADCYAGMYLRWLTDAGGVGGDTRMAAARLFVPSSVGPAPTRPSPWFDETIHGTRLERRQAVGVGYDSGDIRACDAYARGDRPPVLPLGGEVSLRPPVGADVREIGPAAWLLSLPGADVEVTVVPASSHRLPMDTLRALVRDRYGDEARLEAQSGAFPDRPDAMVGTGAKVAFVVPELDGRPRVSGVAAIGSLAGESDRIAVITARPEDPADPASILRAISWGYCDPGAPDFGGCETTEVVAPTPSPTVGPSPDPDELRRRRRETEQWLISRVPEFFADGCRRYRGSGGTADPFLAGATGAITCVVPAKNVAEYAVYQFVERSFRDRFYFGRAYLIGLREGVGSCAEGRGERAWAHGRVACWVSPRAPYLSHIRWTDDREVTYGILDGSDDDIHALYRWWQSIVESAPSP